MKLIVDSGATKTAWSLLGPQGMRLDFTTGGINASHMPAELVRRTVLEAASQVRASEVMSIHFYGAGIIGEPVVLSEAFREYFPYARVEFASDLLGAARAICGHGEGVAAILGTGSNSCYFDGKEIVRNIHSCGFILGDQGGAAALGKAFLSDFLQERMPEDLAQEFAASFDVAYATVVKNVYRGDSPAQYLGSFAPWITGHYQASEYVRSLVDGNFRSFIKDCLCRYDCRKAGIVGGFAYSFKDIVARIGAEEGVEITVFMENPLEGLVAYHAD